MFSEYICVNKLFRDFAANCTPKAKKNDLKFEITNKLISFKITFLLNNTPFIRPSIIERVFSKSLLHLPKLKFGFPSSAFGLTRPNLPRKCDWSYSLRNSEREILRWLFRPFGVYFVGKYVNYEMSLQVLRK